MNHIGIITEYNPFHNGHYYQIKKIKEIFPDKKIIVMMSGNYVQRGEPAIYSKSIRAHTALIGGVDVVFELPVPFSYSSSEHFAYTGVLALAKTGVIDTLCFGAENDDIELLNKIADVFINEPENYKTELKNNLRNGVSFPKARALALDKCFPGNNYSDIINKPNNILAIEYLKAIKKYNLPIKPYIIKRIGDDYNNTSLISNFGSATAIRKSIYDSNIANKSNEKNKHFSAIKDYFPADIYNYLCSDMFSKPIFLDDFLPYIQYKLLYEKHNLTSFHEITKHLSNSINSISCFPDNIDELIDILCGKHITTARLKRNILNIILNKQELLVNNAINNGFVSYIQLLGFKKNSSHIIKEIQNISDVPIINKVSLANEYLCGVAKETFDHQIFIDNLYRQIFYNKYHLTMPSDYEQSVIIEN